MNSIGTFDKQIATAATPGEKDALLAAFAAKVHLPYMVMAAFLACSPCGSCVRRCLISGHDDNSERAIGHDKGSLLSLPHLWLGVLCLFVYVGVEVMAGDAIGTYGQGFGMTPENTKLLHLLHHGRHADRLCLRPRTIPQFVSQQKYLAFSAILGMLFCIGAYVTTGYTSVGFVAALGFANAMMWPAIFPLAIKGLGQLTEFGSAFLIMGIAGGATDPADLRPPQADHTTSRPCSSASWSPATCTSCTTALPAIGSGSTPRTNVLLRYSTAIQ